MIAVWPRAATACWRCTTGGFMSQYPPDASISSGSAPQPVACAAWHSLFWLVFANSIGVLLSILLLFPAINPILGEWTYGRWIMVHINLELYGWTSLPLVGFLFKVYGAENGTLARWCRPVLWAWSAALGGFRCARRGSIFMALRPFQRQALSRLVRLSARSFSAVDACSTPRR